MSFMRTASTAPRTTLPHTPWTGPSYRSTRTPLVRDLQATRFSLVRLPSRLVQWLLIECLFSQRRQGSRRRVLQPYVPIPCRPCRLPVPRGWAASDFWPRPRVQDARAHAARRQRRTPDARHQKRKDNRHDRSAGSTASTRSVFAITKNSRAPTAHQVLRPTKPPLCLMAAVVAPSPHAGTLALLSSTGKAASSPSSLAVVA